MNPQDAKNTQAMKTAGMIGGLGPESTVIYYHKIISAFRAAKGDGSYPALVINSVNLQEVVDLVTAGDEARLAAYLLAAIEKLAAAGADFGFISANTPHVVFDRLQRQSPIPLISIVEATCAEARQLRLLRLGLLGTRFTMEGSFYRDVFSSQGVELVVPEGAVREFLHRKYMDELVNGIVLPETRAQLQTLAERLKAEAGIEGLILGGTELSLILPEETVAGVPVLDTTNIHVRAVVRELLK
ncbi:MAG TPA: amino acid racemase [Terriglobales bacterium]|nr:amino acid racemase [Terriglobales bacterium]